MSRKLLFLLVVSLLSSPFIFAYYSNSEETNDKYAFPRKSIQSERTIGDDCLPPDPIVIPLTDGLDALLITAGIIILVSSRKKKKESC